MTKSEIRSENNRRVKKIKDALNAYAGFTIKSKEDLQTSITDLLTDLMHLAWRKEIGINEIIRTATKHFNAELQEIQ